MTLHLLRSQRNKPLCEPRSLLFGVYDERQWQTDYTVLFLKKMNGNALLQIVMYIDKHKYLCVSMYITLNGIEQRYTTLTTQHTGMYRRKYKVMELIMSLQSQ